MTVHAGDSIASIYETVLTQDHWPRALHDLSRSIGAFGAILTATDRVGLPFQLIKPSSAYAPEQAEYYFHNLGHFDEPEVSTRLSHTEPFTLLTDEAVWGDVAQLDDRPDYRWVRETFGARRRAGIRLSHNKAWLDLLALQFRQGRWEDVPQSLHEDLRRLLPHVAKAVELNRMLALLRNHYSAVLSALDLLRIGVFIVDGSGAIIVRNREAHRIIDATDGLRVGATGRLECESAAGTAALRQAIAEAAATAGGDGTSSHRQMLAQRSSDHHALLIEVTPLRDERGEVDRGLAGAIVFVIDPSNTGHISTDRLGGLFGLTRAETDVARGLIDGLSSGEISDLRNTSEQTVLTQVKSLYAKLSIHRRADLVRLAVSVDPPIDRDRRA